MGKLFTPTCVDAESSLLCEVLKRGTFTLHPRTSLPGPYPSSNINLDPNHVTLNANPNHAVADVRDSSFLERGRCAEGKQSGYGA